MFKNRPTIMGWMTLVVLVLTLAPAGFGQAIDGNLVGTALDPSGATVPGATVELENAATGIKYTASTGSTTFRWVPIP